MITRLLALIAGSVALIANCQIANADEKCPRTIGANKAYSELWPQVETWFGSEALAVMLPKDAIWSTTGPSARIAVKLFWYSKVFQAVAEQGFDGGKHLGFEARIRRLNSGPSDAEVFGPNWAGLEGLGNNWTLLTGIDFPSPGCWEITGQYRDQSLVFVVETIDYTERRDRRINTE